MTPNEKVVTASIEEEMQSDVWFYVAENDVFPEQFLNFLGLNAGLKELFLAAHGELLQAQYWRALQERIKGGDIVSIVPYRRPSHVPRLGIALHGGETSPSVGADTFDD